MRIFTAILLPQGIKKQIQEVTKGRLPVSYVNTENAHITLNFLGEVSDDRIELAKKVFEETITGGKKFEIEFEKIHKFRNQIHIAVKQTTELLELQGKLEKKFQDSGFKFQERTYYPHIKLMNLHMDNIMFRERKIENFPQEEIRKLRFMADRIVLLESRLHPSFAQHILVLETKLND